jgi:hypothetical protein
MSIFTPEAIAFEGKKFQEVALIVVPPLSSEVVVLSDVVQ